jgi:hypothetical protein
MLSVAKVYANAIKDGEKQISDVPEIIRETVEELLKEDAE